MSRSYKAPGFKFITPDTRDCTADHLDLLGTYTHILNNWEILRSDPLLMNTTLHRLEKQKELYEILKANVHAAITLSEQSG